MRKLLQVLLLLYWLDKGQSSHSCSLQGWPMETFSQSGDILIGGVFVVHSGINFQQPTFHKRPKPVSCTGFHIRYYRDVLGLMFAVNEINNSPELLPNITLGFSALDSCMSEPQAVGAVLSLLSGLGNSFPGYNCHTSSAMVGIVGDEYSFLSIPIAQITGVLHFPQISHGATLSTLSNKFLFPSFFRTVSSIDPIMAFVDLFGSFGWTWVGMLMADDDVGHYGGQIIQNRIKRNGGCIAFFEKIHLSYSDKQMKRVVDVIKRSSVNVIVLHSPDVHIKALLDALFNEGAAGKIFIASDYFGLSSGDFSKKALKVLNGTIGLIPRTGTMPEFEEFLLNLHPTGNPSYPFIRPFWEKAFSCQWTNEGSERPNTPHIKANVTCTGEEDLGGRVAQLFETNDLSYTYHAYLAVYAYAHALHSLLGCNTGSNGFYNYGTCGNISDAQHWKVIRYLKKTKFHSKSGQMMKFNAQGDLPASSDVLNMQILNDSFNLVKVGMIDIEATLGEKISVNFSAILWNNHFLQMPISVCSNSCRPGYRKVPSQGRPICCYDCIPCSEGEMTNYTDADECFRCPSDQWSNEDRDRCIPKAVEFLSYDEPLGITLVLTAVILSIFTLSILIIFIQYRETPIIKATNRELSYILLVSLILCFLCCLVFIGQPSTFSCLLRQTFFSVVFSISISSVLAKTIMVILAFKATRINSSLRKWLGPTIPRNVVGICSVLQISICSFWLYSSPPFPILNNKSQKIIFECNEGQKVFFYMTLGFMGFLAMISFLVAFLARNLPGSFNEAKLITFSMLVFCCVWISFIPSYLSTSGKYTVAVQIFAILASSAGLLSCIFLPKCYIILLRPERNNRDFISGSKERRNWIK
ncbi:PREDICTED: extracellular calcium-sensing receptor-like [Nanorana parkeri]|uniref:extracellular calcium-sensing receptor-like n=1 Tax=Nanorana parkeri TaxID=125878 RepID=UPI0008550867|nr:PREDICTED: extracellular calcium-sensing receptor-like [Nanorana parkeri]